MIVSGSRAISQCQMSAFETMGQQKGKGFTLGARNSFRLSVALITALLSCLNRWQERM